MTSAQLVKSSDTAVCEPQPEIVTSRWLERMKALYQEHHQAQFLNLQAEAESLLEQLQVIKQQRLANQNQVD